MAEKSEVGWSVESGSRNKVFPPQKWDLDWSWGAANQNFACERVLSDTAADQTVLYLRQGGQTLLFHVPHQLVPRELQALLHVQLWHVNSDQQVPLLGRRRRASTCVLLHLQRHKMKHENAYCRAYSVKCLPKVWPAGGSWREYGQVGQHYVEVDSQAGAQPDRGLGGGAPGCSGLQKIKI